MFTNPHRGMLELRFKTIQRGKGMGGENDGVLTLPLTADET